MGKFNRPTQSEGADCANGLDHAVSYVRREVTVARPRSCYVNMDHGPWRQDVLLLRRGFPFRLDELEEDASAQLSPTYNARLVAESPKERPYHREG